MTRSSPSLSERGVLAPSLSPSFFSRLQFLAVVVVVSLISLMRLTQAVRDVATQSDRLSLCVRSTCGMINSFAHSALPFSFHREMLAA